MSDAIKYVFSGADACRALGLPDHPRLHHLTLVILIQPNGFVSVGDACPVDGSMYDPDVGVAVATMMADQKAFAARGYAHLETASLSDALQSAIRLEQSGLPAGRYDVSPTSMPALDKEPLTYFGARSATFPVVDGLVEPEAVAAAWDEVRTQIAAADPPFPAHLRGYTISDPTKPKDDAEVPQATLTVYG